MDKVLISNAQGESGIVNVVRYFQNNGKEYMIYSLNEVDESGYTRLYVTKLNGIDGKYVGETLDENEWNEVKNLVKLIVKANKEGMPVPVQDLNSKKINNIMLKDKKVFKLNAPLVNDLGNNKPNFNEEASVEQPSFEIPAQPTFTSQPEPTNNFEPAFNSQPGFELPNMAPAQPTFDMPTPPAFETPVQPTFETQTQPAFEMPGQQTMNTNNNTLNTQNAFDAQSYFNMPTPEVESTNSFQPSFNIPTQPTFETPAQPSFEQSVQPTFETQNNGMFNMNQPTNDYKAMYDEEISKNNALQQEINNLNVELQKYKNIVENIKNAVEI